MPNHSAIKASTLRTILTQAGITRDDFLRAYEQSQSSPHRRFRVVANWRGFFLMHAARLDAILREFRDGLERIYGSRLVRVVLFGSQAPPDAEPDSDIDVMLVLQGAVVPNRETERLSSFTSGLSLKHDAVISCIYMSEEDFNSQQSPLMLNVRREGVLV